MKLPPARPISWFPFLEDFGRYQLSSLRFDLLSALSVALMTIPQSIAYSLLAGLPPTAGLFSAIFGMIFTATFGSTRLLIAGPTVGTAILLQTAIAAEIYTQYPGQEISEALLFHILTQFVVLIGVIQIAAAFFHVGKLLQFVSRPVVLGYFAGIAVALTVTQLFNFTGIPSPERKGPIFLQVGWFFLHLTSFHGPALLLGLASLLLLIVLRKWCKNLPNALIVLLLGWLVQFALTHLPWGASLQTLGNATPPVQPIPQLSLPLLDFSLMSHFFPAALAIASLSILEVFSVARTFAPKIGQALRIPQDVFAVGLSNFLLSFFVSAMPTSISATRTHLNYRLQAKSRLSAVFSALVTALLIFFGWPLVSGIPLATLGALLIFMAPTLIDFRELTFSLRATRADAWVFFLTFFSCLLFTLEVAFFLGILVSIGSYLRKTATPHLVEYAFNAKGRLTLASSKEEAHRKVRIIGIAGDFYFATADLFALTVEMILQDRNVQAVVLRLNNVQYMDASMGLAIGHLHETLVSTGRHLLISGITDEVWTVFQRAGLAKRIGLDNLYFRDESNPQFSTWKACLRAQELTNII
ncbi:MAG: SulP family inorganic anion transporter [Verrucomicrobiota bacterium]|nr:SulP family inorganic anion transporter [Verrucomicrobiota bacterium]